LLRSATCIGCGIALAPETKSAPDFCTCRRCRAEYEAFARQRRIDQGIQKAKALLEMNGYTAIEEAARKLQYYDYLLLKLCSRLDLPDEAAKYDMQWIPDPRDPNAKPALQLAQFIYDLNLAYADRINHLLGASGSKDVLPMGIYYRGHRLVVKGANPERYSDMLA